MKAKSFLIAWIATACAGMVASSGQQAAAIGALDTRLIAIGYNFLTLAPITPGRLFEINKQTGGMSPIGSEFTMEADHVGANLAANTSGQLFNVLGGFPNASNARVNQLTLSGDVAQSVPLSDGTAFAPHVYTIGFDSQDRLHGILLNGSPVVDAPPVLAEINTSTGQAATVAVLDSFAFNSMAFDFQNQLFAVAEDVGLMRIDVNSGDATIIGGDLVNRSPADNSQRPIVFDRDGTMFAAAERLLVVNPLTGATSAVGSEVFGLPYSIVGLAIVAVPEPGTFAVAGMAIPAFFLFRRNHRSVSTAART